MFRRRGREAFAVSVLLLAFLVGCVAPTTTTSCAVPTPPPPAPSPVASPTPVPTWVAAPTATPVARPTVVVLPTASPTYTVTPVSTAVVLPTATATPTVALPTATPTRVPPTPTPFLPTATPAAQQVDFDLAILGIRVTGTLSRAVDASLTNTGNAEATSVWVKVEVFSGGTRVRVNGKDYERVDIGSLGPGATVQRSITLSFGLFDGLRLQSQGALVVATVFSDQATKTLEVSYKP